MNKPAPPPLPSSPDAKLARCVAYLNMAARLAKEAGVPAVANMADQAARLAGMSRIDDEDLSNRETVRRMTPAVPVRASSFTGTTVERPPPRSRQ